MVSSRPPLTLDVRIEDATGLGSRSDRVGSLGAQVMDVSGVPNPE